MEWSSGPQPRRREIPTSPEFTADFCIPLWQIICWSPCRMLDSLISRENKVGMIDERVIRYTHPDQWSLPGLIPCYRLFSDTVHNARFLTRTLFMWSLRPVLAIPRENQWSKTFNRWVYSAGEFHVSQQHGAVHRNPQLKRNVRSGLHCSSPAASEVIEMIDNRLFQSNNFYFRGYRCPFL